jgi:hypothetical protein
MMDDTITLRNVMYYVKQVLTEINEARSLKDCTHEETPRHN